MREPKQKNLYSCPRNIWVRFSESERLHFNKFFASVYLHKEEFDLTDWEQTSLTLAIKSTQLVHRGKYVNTWRK